MCADFWFRAAVSAIALPCFILALPGCDSIVGPAEQEINLRDDIASASAVVRESYGKILDIARHPGKPLRISFSGGSGSQAVHSLELTLVGNGAAEYPHIRIVRDDGAVANLLWGVKNLLPSVKFANDRGQTLIVGGLPIEFGIADIVFGQKPVRAIVAVDWTDLAIKAFAVALAVWIGASVAKLILAAIAFVALNAMAIAILVIAYEALKPILRSVLDTTGWNLGSIQAFFERSVAEIVQTLQGVSDFLK